MVILAMNGMNDVIVVIALPSHLICWKLLGEIAPTPTPALPSSSCWLKISGLWKEWALQPAPGCYYETLSLSSVRCQPAPRGAPGSKRLGGFFGMWEQCSKKCFFFLMLIVVKLCMALVQMPPKSRNFGSKTWHPPVWMFQSQWSTIKFHHWYLRWTSHPTCTRLTDTTMVPVSPPPTGNQRFLSRGTYISVVNLVIYAHMYNK